MKRIILWRRPQLGIAVSLIMILLGAGITFWMEESRSQGMQRVTLLESFEIRAQLEMLAMDQCLNNLLLETGADAALTRNRAPEQRIKRHLDDIQAAFKDHSSLLSPINALRDHVVGEYYAFQGRLIELLEGDRQTAATYCARHFPALIRQRETLFRDLGLEISRFKTIQDSRARRMRLLGLGGLAGILLAAAFAGRVLCGLHSKPLARITEALDQVRQGDLTKRLDWEDPAEFAPVAETLNHLTGELSELVGKAQRSSQQVNQDAAEIEASAAEQEKTVREIATTTAGVGATSKEISTTSKELVRTMNEVSAVAQQAAQVAEDGQTAIARMEATMRQIMDSSGVVTSKLAALSERTTNINSVVAAITKVADQTNLLSLNAAIEAEKAGEYGLGFAVVAMEIRRLADQTAVATYDIERMVKEMHSSVAAGVMGMDKFSEEVRRGTEEGRKVGLRLAQIMQQVQTLMPRFQAVTESVNHQADGAARMSEALGSVSEAARRTAEQLQHCQSAVAHLNGTAASLQANFGKFRT